MPLFYQHNINASEKLGIWKIEEGEQFFFSKVPLHREISHPHKRLQHLAGRYLLQHLFPDFPYELIEIADTRKPFLNNEAYHFSISHCDDYAAALVSRTRRVGIDIELVADLIERVYPKFLGEQELNLLSEETEGDITVACGTVKLPEVIPAELLTLCWSPKEAVYKWYGTGGIDFKNHITLSERLQFANDQTVLSQFLFSKEQIVRLSVKSRFFDKLVLSYVVS